MWMKIQRVKTVIYSVILLVTASSLVPIANAAEKLQTTLRVGTYFRAGHVPDGMVLAQGWVTYHGSHSGFRVWSDEQKAGNTPTVLLLSGQAGSSPSHSGSPGGRGVATRYGEWSWRHFKNRCR